MIKSLHNKSLIGLFIVLTYVMAWGCWFPLSTSFVQNGGLYLRIFGEWHGIPGPDLFVLLGNLSPGIAAVLTIGLASGKNGLMELWSRLTRWNAGFLSYALAFLLPFIYSYSTFEILRALGSQYSVPHSAFKELGYLALTLPFVPLWEEIGWRGFLLPKLEELYASFRASLLVGLIWGLWHAPLLLMIQRPGMAFLDVLIVFCMLSMGLSILFTWVLRTSRGSLLPVIFFHGAHNAASSYFLEATIYKSGWMPFLTTTIMVWLVAIVVLLIRREKTRQGPTGYQGERQGVP